MAPTPQGKETPAQGHDLIGWTSMKQSAYARFYKCDLQLQTPADGAHWQGIRLKPNPTDDDLAASADDFVDACYDADLEAVAITDHNMGGELGLRYLGQILNAVERKAAVEKRRITVFPGFELTAKVPGNIHLLCIFEPDTPPMQVNDTLTLLRLPPDSRRPGAKSPCDLDQVIDIVQEQRHGLVIAAHADRGDGALDDKKYAQGWQQEVVRNPRLLAVELTMPREQWLERAGKVGMLCRNERPFERSHPIAVVNGSDNKRIRSGEGTGDGNAIGARHTWVKMSLPSIEGLRQAFLDHASRIRFGADRPEDLLTHPRIARISITGLGFLDDLELVLSPNLNTLIGGGGTGKSTVLEAIRAATGQPPENGDEVRRLHERVVSGLTVGRVALTCRQGDSAFNLVLDKGEGAPTHGRFPITAFSQREAFTVADSPQATRGFLDGLRRDELEELRHQERAAAEKLASLDDELARRPEIEERIAELAGDIARLEASIAAAEQREAPLARRNLLRREQQFVRSIDERIEGLVGEIEGCAEGLTLNISSSGLRSPATPHADAVEALIARARAAAAVASASLDQAAKRLRTFVAAEQLSDERIAWLTAAEDAERDYAAIRSGGGDTDPAQAAATLDLKRATLAAEQARLAGIETRAESRPDLLQALVGTWRAQVAQRQRVADDLAATVPKTAKADQPYVVVDNRPFADLAPLCALLGEWVDRRSVTDDMVNEMCELATRDLTDRARAGQAIAELIDQIGARGVPANLTLLTERAGASLVQRVTPRRRAQLEAVRPDDDATVTLFRKDGTKAGTLTEGLSVGQRCTAILALALATGVDPIVIDQPEDEIDNEFIYTELVPLLRRAKERRQVIVATHNPNLPVNGDAELICALTASSDGSVRSRGQVAALGSLDRPPVREQVELIMEGSKEAFERRRAKYGF